MVGASTYVLLVKGVLFDKPAPPLAISSSVRKGPVVPRFRLRPVRFGTVTLMRRLFVLTGVDSKRLAKGSSGRSETEMSFLSSSSPSALVVVSNRDRRPWASVSLSQSGRHCYCRLTLLSLTGPPNEVMPLSTFLMIAGCSTTETARDGMGSQGACSFSVGMALSMLGYTMERCKLKTLWR